jgi:hypothetical protein
MKSSSNTNSTPNTENLSFGEIIPFKTCPVCNQKWLTRDDFLSDPKIKLLGYQVNFDELTLGAVLFNHEICLDTLAVMVECFADLKTGPIYRERKFGSDECPGYCLYECNLNLCTAKCECAWVRDVLQKLSHWPKRGISPVPTE